MSFDHLPIIQTDFRPGFMFRTAILRQTER